MNEYFNNMLLFTIIKRAKSVFCTKLGLMYTHLITRNLDSNDVLPEQYIRLKP